MSNLIESYILHIEGGRRYSPNTVKSYRRDLDAMLAYMGTDEEHFDPALLTTDDVREWIVHLSDKGLKETSINRMLSAGNSFYRYLLREGTVTKNPFTRITSLKTPVRLPAFIPESRMLTMLEQMPDGAAGFREMRDALVVLFLYSTGIRLAELIGIDRSDFNSDMTELRVRGKGDKERIVPIVPALRRRITEYLHCVNVENICKSGEKALFLTEKGERISRSGVYRIVNGRLAAEGIQGKRSPHVLRHTFATHLMDNGADLREIQELLGHTSLKATQVYTHNTISRLKEIYESAHPRGNGGSSDNGGNGGSGSGSAKEDKEDKEGNSKK